MRKFVVSFFVSVFLILIYFTTCSSVEATGSVSLSASKTTVNVGDTFTVSVNLKGASIATLTARLSVDAQKVQYVSGPSNSNYSNGRVIYTWTDPTGGDSPLTGGTIATFTFTAKSAGSASFGISGDFFTPEETSANPSFSGVAVSVNNVENNSGGGTTGNQTGGGTTGGQTGGGTTGGQTGGTTGNQTGGTTGNQTGGTTGTQTGGTNGNQTGGTTGNQTGGTTGNQTGGTTGTQTGGTTGNQTGGTTGNQTGVTTGTQTGATAGNQTGGTNGKTTGGQTGNTSGTQTTTPQTNNETTTQNNLAENQPTSFNANLKILQLNIEGINPNFSPENTLYYIIIPENVKNIEVTAEPEDSKAIVQISGNNNIPSGVSPINISVTAEDGTKKDYVINVTKTNNADLANANLENLAIENATLNPEFNSETMDYTAEVFGDMETLNILAVPQNEKANVTIEGNENLQYGENQIKITVVAEDGTSNKVYNIVITKNESINENESIESNTNNNLENRQNNEETINRSNRKKCQNKKNHHYNSRSSLGCWCGYLVCLEEKKKLSWEKSEKGDGYNFRFELLTFFDNSNRNL